MARIRTIKPSFFRHTALFDAERACGLPLRIAFAGLWTCADREGRFHWRPRELKLDCLPFDDVDFGNVLNALEQHGFIARFTVKGELYGHIPSWERHQHVNAREPASSIPAPDQADAEQVPVRAAHVHARVEGEREGKGKEGNGDSLADKSAACAQALAIWQAELGDTLTVPRKLTDARRSALLRRLDGDFDNDLGRWRSYCQRIRGSPFLCGSKGWKATFDWAIREGSVQKVLEGQYERTTTGDTERDQRDIALGVIASRQPGRRFIDGPGDAPADAGGAEGGSEDIGPLGEDLRVA